MREEEEEEWREEGHTRAEENHHHQQEQDNNTDARTQPPPLEYTHDMAHGTAHDDDVIPFEHRNEPDDGAVRAEPDHDAIEPLARELVFPEDTEGNWAEDMEEEIGFNLQGKYRPDIYSPAPSPAPWYPPPPPTSDYRRPRTRYTPNHAWYNPPRTHYTPRRPPFRPYTRPQRARHVPREIRTGHVTTTRRERFRATTHAKRDGPPVYIPPALRSDGETPYESQRRIPWSQDIRRDPPPHRDPPQSPPRRLDNPNWRAPSPNRCRAEI
jgi:hypothetical protein